MRGISVEHGEALLGLVLGAQDVGEQELREAEIGLQREREADVNQRQIERLGLVQNAGEIEQRLGQPVGGGADHAASARRGARRQHRLGDLAAGILLGELLVQRLGGRLLAVTLVKIGDRVGQPPIELCGVAQRLVVILLGFVGMPGEIVEQPELEILQRLEASYLSNCCSAASAPARSPDAIFAHACAAGTIKRCMPSWGSACGMIDRGGAVACFQPVDDQHQLGEHIARIELNSCGAMVLARSKSPAPTAMRKSRLISSGASGSIVAALANHAAAAG